MSFISTEFEQIGDGIFLYKNFISKNIAKKLYDLALSQTNWHSSHASAASITDHEKKIEFIYKKIKNYFYDDVIFDRSCYFQKYEEGQFMGAHQDNNKVLQDIENSKYYTDGVKYKEVNQPIFGTVLYLNKTIGGELIYSIQGISYSPSPGDLIVHEATEKCTHMSSKIIKGNKIVIPGYAYKIIRVPVD